ncbi:tRNA pseudouridine synthase Pus10-like [Amphiura filiformis]|uniref:tRNA pseudouridine synthase Pus10-like n=1 Tax=Amphiura filiformis TaxID=82378 RepID=UPI003B20D4FE
MEHEMSVNSEDAKAVIKELQLHDICPRCILRVLGVKTQWAYRKAEETIAGILSMATIESKTSTDGEDKSDAIMEDNPEDNKQDKLSDTKQNETTSKEDSKQESSVDVEAVKGHVILEKEQPTSATEPQEDQEDDKPLCGLCLGILQGLCDKECTHRIADQIIDQHYQFCSFMMAVTLPLQLFIRENSLWIHMSETLKQPFRNIPSIKEVYKWMAGPLLGEALDVHFHPKSPFEVMVTMKHDESEREVELLLEKHGVITSAAEPPKKKQKGPPRRKKMKMYHAADVAPTRQQVLKAMKEMSHKLFKELFPCPPKSSSVPCSIEVMCSHGSIYIAGRYMKYSRKLSQSPWVVDGQRKTESSVEELICEHTKATLQAEDYKFSSSGREDVDVRTLGRGRPFVVEFINPRMSSLSVEQLKEITKVVNSNTIEVKIRDLQMITRDQTSLLKEGEEEKTKSYSALIWVEKEVQEEDLKFLSEIKELTLKQKTPIRVLHRRPLATRERVVHSMNYEFIDSHHFKLVLNTQAGTYIKEFVHGDFGRTQPNLGVLLKTDADILELDVEAVNLDWPPTIETD